MICSSVCELCLVCRIVCESVCVCVCVCVRSVSENSHRTKKLAHGIFPHQSFCVNKILQAMFGEEDIGGMFTETKIYEEKHQNIQ